MKGGVEILTLLLLQFERKEEKKPWMQTWSHLVNRIVHNEYRDFASFLPALSGRGSLFVCKHMHPPLFPIESLYSRTAFSFKRDYKAHCLLSNLFAIKAALRLTISVSNSEREQTLPAAKFKNRSGPRLEKARCASVNADAIIQLWEKGNSVNADAIIKLY